MLCSMSRLGYSKDLRLRVLSHLSKGHSISSTSALFGVSAKTINNWKRRMREEGHVEARISSSRRATRKIEDAALLSYIESHPSAFLHEIAAHFSCSIPSVWQRLKLLSITRKKNYAVPRKG